MVTAAAFHCVSERVGESSGGEGRATEDVMNRNRDARGKELIGAAMTSGGLKEVIKPQFRHQKCATGNTNPARNRCVNLEVHNSIHKAGIKRSV